MGSRLRREGWGEGGGSVKGGNPGEVRELPSPSSLNGLLAVGIGTITVFDQGRFVKDTIPVLFSSLCGDSVRLVQHGVFVDDWGGHATLLVDVFKV